MKAIRITIGALGATGALAMAAFGAASASAEIAPLSKFVVTPKAGRTVPVRIKGVGVGPQEFIFKKLTITCKAAKVLGEATSAESETLELTISYKECEGGPATYGGGEGMLPVKFKEDADIVYHYAGWLESLEEVEMWAKPLNCVTYWEGETYPEKAEEKPTVLYPDAKYKTEEVDNSNAKVFPTGKQKKLLITNEVKGRGLEYETEGEEGVCEKFTGFREGENGRYIGKLLVEDHTGNIEFATP